MERNLSMFFDLETCPLTMYDLEAQIVNVIFDCVNIFETLHDKHVITIPVR